jgi:hypothetical protein
VAVAYATATEGGSEGSEKRRCGLGAQADSDSWLKVPSPAESENYTGLGPNLEGPHRRRHTASPASKARQCRATGTIPSGGPAG